MISSFTGSFKFIPFVFAHHNEITYASLSSVSTQMFYPVMLCLKNKQAPLQYIYVYFVGEVVKNLIFFNKINASSETRHTEFYVKI
jgi:hypothetical protein